MEKNIQQIGKKSRAGLESERETQFKEEKSKCTEYQWEEKVTC